MACLRTSILQVLAWITALSLLGFGLTYISTGSPQYGVIYISYSLLAYSTFIFIDAFLLQTILSKYLPLGMVYLAGFPVLLANKAYALRLSYIHSFTDNVGLFFRAGFLQTVILYITYVAISVLFRKSFRNCCKCWRTPNTNG